MYMYLQYNLSVTSRFSAISLASCQLLNIIWHVICMFVSYESLRLYPKIMREFVKSSLYWFHACLCVFIIGFELVRT